MTSIRPKPRAERSAGDPYAVCVGITRARARNLYYGIRLLPPPKRTALCAVYALARRIDDIGDGDLAPADKLARLAALRTALAGPPDGDPVLAAVADAARHAPIPLAAFGELIDGVEMDVQGQGYQTFADLETYCRRVAGAVGRLCLGVFGSRPDPAAPRYADALGIALQQTNILRDLREDLGNGRVYVPRSDLDRFGVDLRLDGQGRLADPYGRLAELIRFSAARAGDWYEEGLRLVPLLDRRSAASTLAMAGIYRSLLDRIARQPSVVYDRRLSLSGLEKARVAARALAGTPG